jgi:lysophospholipase L1-like esterase
LRTPRLRFSLLIGLVAAACGGGSSPTDPGTPTPPPGTPVTGVVFYDENANGLLDPAEVVRLPGVTVSIGGRTAASGTGGRFTVDGVAAGAQQATLRPESLPAYFAAGTPVNVSTPQTGGEIAVPAVLAIGSRSRPNVYLAFGDSITSGEGSSDGGGYRDFLAAQLRSYWGRADVLNGGRPGTKSNDGEGKIAGDVASYRPAYVLILYGTNDWNTAACRNAFPCDTVDNLRSMIVQSRAGGAMPIVGTIPPVNPLYVDRQAEDRNDWVKRMNVLVRAMAAQERAPVADVHGAFLSQASLPPLFSDFLHPNDQGYLVMSRSFFDAVTKPLAGSAAAAGPPLVFDRP